jgi:hypothetical protein
MRLKNATGLYGPLLAAALAAASSGCATDVIPQPDDFKQSPTVKAIYATDFAQAYNNDFVYLGFEPMSDVMIYSASEPTRTGKTPPSYGGFRIEFSQPLTAASIATNSDVASVNTTLLSSFCSPIAGGSPITLVDVDDPAIGTIAASVCYDPASALGSFPNVVVVPGKNGAYTAGANPFTCNSFTSENGTTHDPLKANHKYSLKFDAARITGGPSAKPVTLPSDAGWASGSFSFTTDDFSLLAVGYQDQTTGYFIWLDKPNKGFMKDLDPLGDSKFVIPADDTALLFIMSTTVGFDPNDGSLPDGTVTRADGSSNDGYCYDWGDAGSRIVGCSAGLFWESNGSYKVTLPTTVMSADGTALPAQAQYTIKAGAASPRVRIVTPGDATVANSIFTKSVSLRVQEPVDAGSLAGVVVKKAGAVVPGTAAIDPGTNGQMVRYTFTAGTVLDPNTTYTIEGKGMKVAASTPNAGATIADFTSTFNTATFRSVNIYSSLTSSTGIDRSVTQAPTTLRSGTLNVRFTNAPTAGTVTNTSVVLGEIDQATGAFTAIDSSKYTVTAGSSATQFIIKITDTTYPLKWSQKYGVKLLQTITDALSGQKLTAEGCTAADCTEVRSFTTAPFAPTLAVTDRAKGTFTVTFNVAVDPSSVNDFVNTAYKLYPQAADGSLGAPIVMTCTPYTTNSTTCTTSTVLAANSKYVASATFLQTLTAGQSGPVKVAATVSGFPTDTGAGSTFYGNRSALFRTPCP